MRTILDINDYYAYLWESIDVDIELKNKYDYLIADWIQHGIERQLTDSQIIAECEEKFNDLIKQDLIKELL